MEKDMHSRKMTWYNLSIENGEFPMLHFKLLFILNTIKGSPNQLLKLTDNTDSAALSDLYYHCL